MDKRFVITAIALALAVTGGILFAGRGGRAPEAIPLVEAAPGIERRETSEESAAAAEAWTYLIREYEGRVAVFTPDAPDSPEIVYDTLVRTLPDTDREELRQGVPVRDYSELVSRVEDYIS